MKLIEKLIWIFDHYVAYFLTNGNKRRRYHEQMKRKYPDRYRES